MAENDGDKSQEATPHRRQQAREQGQVPHSQDLTSAALLVLGLVTLWLCGGRLAEFLGGYWRGQLGGEAWLSVDTALAANEFGRTAWGLLGALLPIFGAVFVAAILVNLMQVGFLFLPERLAADLSRIDPLQGLQRLFSLQSGARLVFGLVKMALVATVAGVCVYNQRAAVFAMSQLTVPQLAVSLVELLFWIGLKIAVALLILAILDYGFQRWKHERDIRMTPQEMREELKNLEGNPQMLSRRRQVQRQLLMNRLADAVPKADVIITNPTELAIAIQYDPGEMAAPVVVAKGAGFMAARIRRLALDQGIPIVEKKPLAQYLYREVELNHPIPADKYAAVAEVLAYVYQLRGKKIPQPGER
jgi:flagellar biosynthesis protein FlhB